MCSAYANAPEEVIRLIVSVSYPRERRGEERPAPLILSPRLVHACMYVVQSSQKMFVRGCEKFLPALAYLFCLALPGSCLARFTYFYCEHCMPVPAVIIALYISTFLCTRGISNSNPQWWQIRQTSYETRLIVRMTTSQRRMAL